MNNQINLISLVILFLISSISVVAQQYLRVSGEAKIGVMQPATNATENVVREPDGTLTVIPINQTTTYNVGDFAQGGVVFWVSPSGKHGKVVSIYNHGTVDWDGVPPPASAGAVGSAARSGLNGAGNTAAIILYHDIYSAYAQSTAASICAEFAYGGYDDWYLPAIDELGLIASLQAVINPVAVAHGGENFISNGGGYWSSTECSTFPDSHACWDSFTGTQLPRTKTSAANVRAVRAF